MTTLASASLSREPRSIEPAWLAHSLLGDVHNFFPHVTLGRWDVAGCDVFLQRTHERLSCAVYRTLEHLWEVKVQDTKEGGVTWDVMMASLVEKKLWTALSWLGLGPAVHGIVISIAMLTAVQDPKILLSHHRDRVTFRLQSLNTHIRQSLNTTWGPVRHKRNLVHCQKSTWNPVRSPEIQFEIRKSNLKITQDPIQMLREYPYI